MSVSEEEGLAGVVIGSELSADGLDVNRYSTYDMRCSMDKAVEVTAFGGGPLRAVLSALRPIDMWKRFTFRYAGFLAANKIGVLRTLMNTHYISSKNMREYLAELEASLNKLNSMGLSIAEEMEVEILLV